MAVKLFSAALKAEFIFCRAAAGNLGDAACAQFPAELYR